MSTRIQNGNEYLYCDISDNPNEYIDLYTCADAAMDDIRDAIVAECEQRDYSEDETRKVLSHYEIKLGNYSWESEEEA